MAAPVPRDAYGKDHQIKRVVKKSSISFSNAKMVEKETRKTATARTVIVKDLKSEKKDFLEGQKSGICVALQKDKTIIRVEGNNPADFASILRESEIAWINFTIDDIRADGSAIAKALGFSEDMIPTLLSSYQHNYEDRDSELGLKIPAVSVENLDVTVYPLIILLRKGLILSLHEAGITRLARFARYSQTAMRKLAAHELWEDKLTILLWRIIDESHSRNFEYLMQIEGQADHLVKELMDPTTPRERVGPHIYKMKHALVLYLDALWMSFDLINNLRYGDAETLSDDPILLDRISALAYDVTNQISLSEHMSEVLASGLEVMQSIYNNQLQILNNKLALLMAWLTVLGTAVLVPNTLATIFGLSVISDNVDGGILMLILIVSTIVSVIGSYWFVQKRKLVPKHVE